ncbi:MAG: hypothetical protein ACTMIA_12605 [Vibrio sp.]
MRQRTRRYIDDYPCLDLTAILKLGFFEAGRTGQSSSKRGNYELWSFVWNIQENHITAHYKLSGGDKDGNYEHYIKLLRQPAHYGNDRVYLQCPHCHVKRKKIYFSSGVAACRICHNLHYRSQSESSSERKYRKLDRLLDKVQNFGSRFDGHWKKKTQHWKTYHRLDKEISRLQQSIFVDIDNKFGFGEAERHFGKYEID